MTPDERAALDRQRRIALAPSLLVERHEPLDGQESFLLPPCHLCGSPIVRHRGRWCCPKCANIEEDQ